MLRLDRLVQSGSTDARSMRLAGRSQSLVSRQTIARCSLNLHIAKRTGGTVCAARRGKEGTACSMNMDCSQLASLLRIQNMIKLCKQLKLPVVYKVNRINRQSDVSSGMSHVSAADTSSTKEQHHHQYGGQQQQQQQQLVPGGGSIELAVVVHVLSDHAFKKYLQYCTTSDLMLLRGLLLKVEVDKGFQHIISAKVQQAFLPKFENEGQDSSIADSIVQQAGERPLVVTIKHSGSLVTLSHEGFAAKNSLDNEFTAGAALLLQSHFHRLLGPEKGAERLQELMAALKRRQLALSFEMVTGCHGHHGQLPAGEYLVTTSAHTISPSGQPSFLPWQDFLHLCLEWGLPLNDTWIVCGKTAATAARELLDHLALSGSTTTQALQQLNTLTSQQGSAAGSDNGHTDACGLHLPGTYPHDEWQGSRLEGFVASQGERLTGPQAWQGFVDIAQKMASQVLALSGVSEDLRKPYQQLLRQSGDKIAATHTAVKSLCAHWLPNIAYEAIKGSTDRDRPAVIDLLDHVSIPLDSPAALHLPDGSVLFSRAALDGLNSSELQQVVPQAATRGDPSAAALLTDSVTPLQAMQLVSGPGGPQQAALRYKKKMLMWSDAEVGYCMMTFVIRNHLTALKRGEVSYLTALTGMARHSWGLPEALVEKVVYFGRCWSRWIKRHGGVDSITDANYLTAAEPFVRDFLAGVAGDGGEVRPQGAFQGVVLAVDASDRLVQQLQKQMHFQHLLQATSGDLVFSKSLVREGTCLWLRGDKGLKQHTTAFIKSAAPYAHLLVQPPKASGTTPEVKKATGMHTSKVRTLSKMLTAPGLLSSKQLEERSYYLPTSFAAAVPKPQHPGSKQSTVTIQLEESSVVGTNQEEDEVTEERLREAVSAVAQKFGTGTPPGDADPAFIACFVGLPGIGKSVLVSQLQQLLANNSDNNRSSSSSSSSSGGSTSIAVLNSDILKAKQGISGMRYWHQVVGACDSARGGGHRQLVLADKNLVPSPKDNLTRVADIINKSGATTLVVVPTCTVLPTSDQDDAINPSSGSSKEAALQQQQRQRSTADLPFPLELVALCLLRVLERESHEGGLDASLAHAMSVVVTFVSFFRNMTAVELRQQLLGCFQHVVQLPVAAIGGDRQVPAAVLDHIAEGLSKVSANSDPPLPPEWESHMCQLLKDPANQAAITAIGLPLEDCAARLQGLLTSIISNSCSANGAAAGEVGGGGGDLDAGAPSTGVSCSLEGLGLESLKPMDYSAAAGVRYIGVAVLGEEQLKQQLQQLLQELLQQQQVGLPTSIKSELHVTLWHSNNTGGQAAQREALMTTAGQEVQLRIVAIDCSPEVTAAQVELISAPDAVADFWRRLEYPHITLAVSKGTQAVDSNQLPRRVADAADVALRVQLQQPVLVVGQVLAFA